MILSTLVLGLLLAVALGSIRTAAIALVLLLCVLFPVWLVVVVPAILGGVCVMVCHWRKFQIRGQQLGTAGIQRFKYDL